MAKGGTKWTYEGLAKQELKDINHPVKVSIEVVIDGQRHVADLCVTRSRALCDDLFSKSTADKQRIKGLELNRSCLCTKTNFKADFIITRLDDPLAKLYKDPETGEMVTPLELQERITERGKKTKRKEKIQKEVEDEIYRPNKRRDAKYPIVETQEEEDPRMFTKQVRLTPDVVEKKFPKQIEGFFEEPLKKKKAQAKPSK